MRKVRTVGMSSRTATNPVPYPKTVRHHDIEVYTSMPAGRMTPISAIPVLQEDSARVRVAMAVQMMETNDLLINPVHVSVKAYLVPNLAFERFQSFDDLVRSFKGEPPRPGMPVVPYIEHMISEGTEKDPILRHLGEPVSSGSRISTAFHEAYNLIWNFRAANRSPSIYKRDRLDNTLAPAFWHHSQFAHIVPDWDQALMEGQVALNVVEGKLPIRNLYVDQYTAQETTGYQNGIQARPFNRLAFDGGQLPMQIGSDTTRLLGTRMQDVGEIFAEFQQNGITVSLSTIEQARKMQSFAKLRESFAGHSDDYIIDTLMEGLTIPDQAWRQPMLLADVTAQFGMAQRYATNGGDLTQSVVNGATMLELNFGSPKCATGGVIMIVAEALPKQLFERGRSPYLHLQDVEQLPSAMRDTLTTLPVEPVENGYIDNAHSRADDSFGYAPLNHKWNYAHPRIGGRFFNPKPNAPFREDRQRIWAIEVENPVLGLDFYIARHVNLHPFVDLHMDPFEVVAQGGASLTGITQFGPVLIEASDNYEEIKKDAPLPRPVKPASPAK